MPDGYYEFSDGMSDDELQRIVEKLKKVRERLVIEDTIQQLEDHANKED